MGQKADARSDIYSLGCVMFEVLTGGMPFVADSPIGLLQKHVNEPIPDLEALHPDLPLGIGRVVKRALAKDCANRFQSADALADDIRLVLSGKGKLVRVAKPNAPMILRLSNKLGRVWSARKCIEAMYHQSGRGYRILLFPTALQICASILRLSVLAQHGGVYAPSELIEFAMLTPLSVPIGNAIAFWIYTGIGALLLGRTHSRKSGLARLAGPCMVPAMLLEVIVTVVIAVMCSLTLDSAQILKILSLEFKVKYVSWVVPLLLMWRCRSYLLRDAKSSWDKSLQSSL